MHYLGEMAHVISQGFGVCLFLFFFLLEKSTFLLKPEHNKVHKKRTSSMMLIYSSYTPEGM